MRFSSLLLLAICVAVGASAPAPDIASFPYIPRNVIETLSPRDPPVSGVNTTNVVTVPDNCPDGQELINGQCRDIWRRAAASDVEPGNIITVPPNCPDGQEFVNGQCREILPKLKIIDHPALGHNVASVTETCLNGQQLVNGVCREILNKVMDQEIFNSDENNVNNVPNNCHSGQQLINGQCRDIWRNTNAEPPKNSVNQFGNAGVVKTPLEIGFKRSDFGYLLKNIVQVPNQCPDGYRPDNAGICREIWLKRSL